MIFFFKCSKYTVKTKYDFSSVANIQLEENMIFQVQQIVHDYLWYNKYYMFDKIL